MARPARQADPRESADSAVFTLDTRGAVATWNLAAQRALGHSASGILGRKHDVFFRDEDVAAGLPRKLLADAAKTGRAELECSQLAADGTECQATVVVSAVRNSAGELIGYARLLHRVAEHGEREDALNAAEERFRMAFENAPIGVALVSLDRRWLEVNDALCTMLGRTREELVGSKVNALTHPDDRVPQQGVGDLIGGRTAHITLEKRYLRDDGQIIWANVSIGLVRGADGRPLHYVSQTEDITERHLAEVQRRQSEDEANALRVVAETVAEGSGSSAVFERIAEQAGLLLAGGVGAVFQFEGERRDPVATWTRDGLPIETTFQLEGETAMAEVSRVGRTAIVEYPVGDTTDEAILSLRARGLGAGAAAPIYVQGRLWGAVAVSTEAPLEPAAVKRLDRFAHLASLAVGNAEAYERLAWQATTDAATGLSNRRVFGERLGQEIARAERHQHPLSLLLLDLDHFKQVNDAYGHQVGDRVLVETARRFQAQGRETDLIARIGGEEFGWILPETDEAGALTVARRVRAAIADEPFGGVGTVTISVGVCSFGTGMDAEAIMRHADQALYAAKDAGRNIVVVHSESLKEALDARMRSTDGRSRATRNHTQRVADLAEALASELGCPPDRARRFAPRVVDALSRLAESDTGLLEAD